MPHAAFAVTLFRFTPCRYAAFVFFRHCLYVALSRFHTSEASLRCHTLLSTAHAADVDARRSVFLRHDAFIDTEDDTSSSRLLLIILLLMP